MTLSSMPHGPWVSRNVNLLHDEVTSPGDRLADALARFGGSWLFITVFGGVLTFWLGLNSLRLLVVPFDPSPYIALNLALSVLAAIQAPIILMSQNRQAARARLTAEQDYACNLKAEAELARLHEKLDRLLEAQRLDRLDWPRQPSAQPDQSANAAGEPR